MSEYEHLEYARFRLALARIAGIEAEIIRWKEEVEHWLRVLWE